MKNEYELLNIYNCHDNFDFDDEYGDCYEVIDKLYNISNQVDIRFNRNEEPFEAVISKYNGQIIGGSVINESQYPDTFSFSLVILPNHQSKGVGKELINNAIDFASDSGFEKVSMYVVNDRLAEYLSNVLKFEYKGMQTYEKKL